MANGKVFPKRKINGHKNAGVAAQEIGVCHARLVDEAPTTNVKTVNTTTGTNSPSFTFSSVSSLHPHTSNPISKKDDAKGENKIGTYKKRIRSPNRDITEPSSLTFLNYSN